MSLPPKRPSNLNTEAWNEWENEVSEIKQTQDRKRDDGEENERVSLFSGIQRFFVLMFWRPASTIAYLIGLTYGSLCIYLFAHGELIEPYGFVEDSKRVDLASIPHSTLVVSQDGVLLMIMWLVIPPIWFFIEGYVLCKTTQQRAYVKEAQEISIKVWLAMLGVMAILAK